MIFDFDGTVVASKVKNHRHIADARWLQIRDGGSLYLAWQGRAAEIRVRHRQSVDDFRPLWHGGGIKSQKSSTHCR